MNEDIRAAAARLGPQSFDTLRHLFALSCRFPARPLSYNKMLGAVARGRLVESAAGAHLLNHLQDAAIRGGDGLWAMEVKSGRPSKLRGLDAFCRRHRKARPIIVGAGGTELEEFFLADPRAFLIAR